MPVRWLSAEALQSERIRRRMEHECHISQSYVDPTAYRKARRHANGLINFSRSAGLELGRACNTEKVNWPGLSDARARPGRAGPCHSFWLKSITMVRKTHVGLMMLAAEIPRSFKSGLTYEHMHDLAMSGLDSSINQALLFHLILISILVPSFHSCQFVLYLTCVYE